MVKLKELHWHIVRQDDSFRSVQTSLTFQGKKLSCPSYSVTKIRFHPVLSIGSSYFMTQSLVQLWAGCCSLLLRASPDIKDVKMIYKMTNLIKTARNLSMKVRKQWKRAKRCEYGEKFWVSSFSHLLRFSNKKLNGDPLYHITSCKCSPINVRV